MQKVESYRPLPPELYIGTSSIEGNGLFTLKYLEKNKELGISHVKYSTGDFHSDFIRTPLGGFVNHDPENPNCVVYECGEFLKLKTTLGVNLISLGNLSNLLLHSITATL